jgi:hypothetical protein
MSSLRVAFLSGAVLELAATIGVALVAVTVGVRLVDGGIGFRAGLIVLVLAPELYLPIRNVAAQFHASADGAAVAGRLLDLVEAPPAVAVPRRRREVPDLRTATIRFEQVSFGYPGRGRLALDEVDSRSGAGRVGRPRRPSGAGKSTIASLLLRLAEPTAGRVLADGLDVADFEPEEWRRQLAWLPQLPSLLRGTVAENIRLADPAAGFERVTAAAALAGAAASSRLCRTGTRPSSATVVGRSRPGRRAGSRWPGVPPRRPARDPRRAHRAPRPGERGARRGWDRRLPGSLHPAADHPSSRLAAHCDRIVRIEDARRRAARRLSRDGPRPAAARPVGLRVPAWPSPFCWAPLPSCSAWA